MATDSAVLFKSFNLKDLLLNNRMVMAPLTRNRAIHGTDVPQELNAEYYSQRAGAGLIISEATQISLTGKGRPFIANPDLVERFKTNSELNLLDQETLYGGTEKGYTDYSKM